MQKATCDGEKIASLKSIEKNELIHYLFAVNCAEKIKGENGDSVSSLKLKLDVAKSLINLPHLLESYEEVSTQS
jgi:hypothetical protein